MNCTLALSRSWLWWLLAVRNELPRWDVCFAHTGKSRGEVGCSPTIRSLGHSVTIEHGSV